MIGTLVGIVGMARLVCPDPVPLLNYLLDQEDPARQAVIAQQCQLNMRGFQIEAIRLIHVVGEFEVWEVQIIGGPIGYVFAPAGRVDGGEVAEA